MGRAAPSCAIMSEALCRAPRGSEGRTERSLVTDTSGCSIWPLPSFNPETQVFSLLPRVGQGGQCPFVWLALAQQQQRATVGLACVPSHV